MEAAEGSSRRRFAVGPVILAALIPVAAVVGALYVLWVVQPRHESQQLNEALVLHTVGLSRPVDNKLSERFSDADGDLVADSPSDAKQLADPDRLVFSYVGVSDAEYDQKEYFKEFIEHLSKVTGKKVEYLDVRSSEEQLQALRDGKLHVTGVNTGAVPLAVDVAGFVPIAKLASADGTGSYEMQIIVPADSPIQSTRDLAGTELALTEPNSNSGFKAPLVLLKDEMELLPGRDFGIRYSGSHQASIEGIAKKEYQAAAVASDMLQRGMAQGQIQANQFRTIYKSEDFFPTAAFGYCYNLKPELSAKVRQAFETFDWKGTGLEKMLASSNQTKFAPANYKQDWEMIREIDNEIGNEHKLAATTQATTQPAQ